MRIDDCGMLGTKDVTIIISSSCRDGADMAAPRAGWCARPCRAGDGGG